MMLASRLKRLCQVFDPAEDEEYSSQFWRYASSSFPHFLSASSSHSKEMVATATMKPMKPRKSVSPPQRSVPLAEMLALSLPYA